MSGNIAIQGTSTSRATGEGTSTSLSALKQYSVIRPDSPNNSAATIDLVRNKLIELGRLAQNDTNPDTFFAAVRKYQQEKGLKVDGIVGQQTLGSMFLLNDCVPPGTRLLSKAAVADAVPEFRASAEFIQTHDDEYVAGNSGADGAGAPDAADAQAASLLTEEEMMAQGMEVISKGAGTVGGAAAVVGTALALRKMGTSGQLANLPARAKAATQAARQAASQLATKGGAKAAATGARSALQAAGAALKANPGAVLKGVAGKALPIAGVAYMAYNLKDQMTADKATWKKVANGMAVVAGACALVPGIGWGAAALLTVGSIGLSMV